MLANGMYTLVPSELKAISWGISKYCNPLFCTGEPAVDILKGVDTVNHEFFCTDV